MFTDEINLIDNRLKEMMTEYQEMKPLFEYALFPGGKRLRPLLLLLILKDLKIDLINGLDIACAIEFIHTYSLIHDDLPAMDNDEMRRNKLTLHLAHGEANAILAGDALLTEAFFWIANANLDANKKIQIISLVSKYAGANGMIRGQYLDIHNNSIVEQDIEQIHIHKTTDLFYCAIASAPIIANKDLEGFLEFSIAFGKAFQIKDDLEDIDKEEQATIVRAIGVDASMMKFTANRVKSLELIENLVGKGYTYQLVENIL